MRENGFVGVVLEKLFVRDPGNMGAEPSGNFVHLAVKYAITNARIIEIIQSMGS